MKLFRDLSLDKQIELIEKQCLEGSSTTELMSQIWESGYRVISRNAMIGWIDRHGHKTDFQFVRKGQSHTRRMQPGRRKGVRPPAQKGPEKPVEYSEDKFDLQDPKSSMPYLDAVHGTHCGFPLWKDGAPVEDKKVCGAAVKPKSVWCEYHHARLTQKPTPKPQRKAPR